MGMHDPALLHSFVKGLLSMCDMEESRENTQFWGMATTLKRLRRETGGGDILGRLGVKTMIHVKWCRGTKGRNLEADSVLITPTVREGT